MPRNSLPKLAFVFSAALGNTAMKLITLLSICALTAFTGGEASATTQLEWTIPAITFDNGATASGTFLIYDQLGDYSQNGLLGTWWDITLTAGTAEPGFVYTPLTSSFVGTFAANSFVLQAGSLLLALAFTSDLTVPVLDNAVEPYSYEYDYATAINGNAEGGFASASAFVTPEPSTWAMMLIGFAGLGIAGYRASRKNVALAA